MDTRSPNESLRERLDSWLSELSDDGQPSLPLPDGAETGDLVEALRERERRHLGQAATLMELTALVGSRANGLVETLRRIAERTATTLDIARVGVWRFTPGWDTLTCVELFELDGHRHSSGTALRASEFPRYFTAVAGADLLDPEDAFNDPRTSEFAEGYLRPIGIGAMLDAAIHVGGVLAGVICCEHVGPPRRWRTGERAFAVAVANLVSLAFEIDERERAQSALRASEQRFRSVARALTDTIWDWDLVTNTVWWNDGIEKQFGHRVADLPPGPESWLDRVHPDDRTRVSDGIHAAIDGADASWEDEYRFLCADGGVVFVQDTGTIIRDERGRAVRMLGGLVDVTASRAAEVALVRARELAEEASRAKTEFLANMSHEMRTPLTAVLGFSDLLMDPTLSAGDRLDYIQSIRRNGAHLLSLIDDVLDLSSMDTKVAQLRRTECSLHRILNEVASMMQVRASYKGLRFSLRYETPIPATIVGDPDRVRQILLKLIGNAIKFTDSGEIRLVARLRIGGSADSAIEIDVVDSGIGIAEGDLSRVFQPFWQAHGSANRRHGGSGLGLPICLPIARAMGGDILVRSEPGVGSVFTLRLPHAMTSAARMVRSPDEDVSVATRPSATAEIDADLGDLVPEPVAVESTSARPTVARILLAEDGPDNQLVISAMLRKRGFDVTVVDNGVDAVDRALLAAASGRPFQVILMDMQMPRLDGYGATALLRSRGYGRPIFALTAHAMPDERKRCIVAGCDEFMSKPVEWPTLLETIDSYLQREETGDVMEFETTRAGAGPNGADDRAPIHSTLADDPDMAELVSGFVERLPGQIVEIRDALHRGDAECVRRLAHQLKGAGGSYGFDAVSENAALLEQAIKDGASSPEVIERVERFEAVCSRVRSGPAAAGTEA